MIRNNIFNKIIISGFIILLSFPVIAKAQATASWNTGPESNANYGPGPSNCDPAIQQQQQTNQINGVNDATALAKSNYPVLPEGMQQLSCIQNLMNGGSNLVFEPPNIGSILNLIEQAVCTEGSNLYAQATQPLQSAIGSFNNAANQSVNTGSLGLGTIGTGVSIQPYSQYGVNGPLVNSNIGQILSNPGQSLGIPPGFGSGLFSSGSN